MCIFGTCFAQEVNDFCLSQRGVRMYLHFLVISCSATKNLKKQHLQTKQEN